MYSASASTTPTDFPRVPGDAMFSRLPRVSPMDFPPARSGDNVPPPPRSNRRGQDGCPSPAHLYPSSPPTSPHCPPYPPTHLPRTSGAAGQLTLLIKGRGRQGGGGAASQEGGGAAPEQRWRQSRERPHRQQKGTFLLSQRPLSHKVTDSERSLLE